MPGHRLASAVLSVTLLAGATSADAAGAARRAPVSAPVITVLSNRADLLSGGDALVRVTLPARARRQAVRVTVGSRSVTRAFRREGRVLTGLVEGLPVGRSTLTVRLRDRSGARLTLVNHPSGGPVFAGPQPQPWTCQKGALDKQCNQAPTFSFFYRSTQGGALKPYDRAAPPRDVATVRTDGGVTVPFVVRMETGYLDRDQYRIATLFDPAKPWTALDPQPQFAHKLLVTHGASCNVSYTVGNAPSVLSYNPAGLAGVPTDLVQGLFPDSAVTALGRGYAVMSTALDNNGHNCNLVTQAESLVMAKERVIERYGTVRFTIGTGCSGGSLTQQWVANAYPGLYDGILPTCSFPDTWTSATQVMDYHLLRAYLEHPDRWGPGVLWSPTQWAAVEGHVLPVDAIASDLGFFDAIVPTHACPGVSDAQRYSAANPAGVRCSIADLSINVLGPRPSDVWTAPEKAIGRGFAGIPVDNVGVQYGLAALRSGQITPFQFADLNRRIGGLDIDINPVPQRIAADLSALGRAYRSGFINETTNLDQTAIIDCRGPDPGAAHDSYRAFAIRARLDREHGSHANQLIWEGPTPLIGDTTCADRSLRAMDRWLTAVVADTRAVPVARKLVEDRPSDLGDACLSGVGGQLRRGLCGTAIDPIYGTPRTVAGDAITTDANKCRLKPLDRSSYGVPFTDAEWASVVAAFPSGVCDYAKPGVLQQPTVPWQTYQDARGRVVYGGVAMGPAPVSRGFGRR